MSVSHHFLQSPYPFGLTIFEDQRFSRVTAVLSDLGDHADQPIALYQLIASVRRRFLSKTPGRQIAWVYRKNGTRNLQRLTINNEHVDTAMMRYGELSNIIHRGGGFRREVFLPTFLLKDNSGPPELQYHDNH